MHACTGGKSVLEGMCCRLTSFGTALPIHRISRMDPEPFRVLLLRRLRMPLSLKVRACRCGRVLDVLGHHRAAWNRVGELGKRGFESAVTQICREGGARVSTNVMLRDLVIFTPGQTDDVWKWWPKGCVCSAGASLLWMPPSSPRRWRMEMRDHIP